MREHEVGQFIVDIFGGPPERQFAKGGWSLAWMTSPRSLR
jgi:hypothetical protein